MLLYAKSPSSKLDVGSLEPILYLSAKLLTPAILLATVFMFVIPPATALILLALDTAEFIFDVLPATLVILLDMPATVVTLAFIASRAFRSLTKSLVDNWFKSDTKSDVATKLRSEIISDVANVFKSDTKSDVINEATPATLVTFVDIPATVFILPVSYTHLTLPTIVDV